MKLTIFTPAVAVATIMLLAMSAQIHGLPGHLRTQEGVMADNKELEQAVLQTLLSMTRSSATSQNARAESNRHFVDQQSSNAQRGHGQVIESHNKAEMEAPPRSNQLKAKSQYSGVTIEDCGTAGTIIQNALTFGLSFIPGGSSAYGVYVKCPTQSYPCTIVTVDVPADEVKADIDVCSQNGQLCVQVYGGTCTPGPFAFPLPITIPAPDGQQVSVTIRVDVFTNCASVEVLAPACQ